MKKVFVQLALLLFCFSHTFSQGNKNVNDTVSREYIPIEGRSQSGVPPELQGTWVLQSGVKTVEPAMDLTIRKPEPGTETKRDSVTYTTTINGETRTTTEVNIERIGTPEKQITPPQKGNMHKAEKPSISFYGSNETFSGFTGCNKYSGRYRVSGNKLLLLNGAASTKMVCVGEYDEKDFLNTLKKVNAFRANGSSLELLNDGEVLLVFARK